MAKKQFSYIGLTPAHGAIYEKGSVQIVVYTDGTVRYWHLWPNYEIMIERKFTGNMHTSLYKKYLQKQ